MNLNRLLLIAIGVPAIFVVTVIGASYFPHQAELLSHGGEHIALSVAIVIGIIPFSFLMLRIFRRIERHIIDQNRELSQRTRETEALLKVGRAVEASLEMDRVLPMALEAMVEGTNAEAAEVWLLNPQDKALYLRFHQGSGKEAFLETDRFAVGEGYPGIVLQTGNPLFVDDLQNDARFLRQGVKDEGFNSYYALPLRRTGNTIGVLAVAARDSTALASESELGLLELMAEHIATAVENAQLHEEVQTLAILTERERLAREMHDGLAQVLGYVNTKAQAVKELLRSDRTDVAIRQMEQLESAAQETYDDVREAILALSTNGRKRPLLESMEEYIARFSELTDLPTHLSVEGEPYHFNPAVEVQVLRIVQEGLSNVRRHARASGAEVTLAFRPSGCRLAICDDGQGFDPEHTARGLWPHLGLQSMQERAVTIGARFTLDTAPGRGTKVIIDMPKSAGTTNAEDHSPYS